MKKIIAVLMIVITLLTFTNCKQNSYNIQDDTGASGKTDNSFSFSLTFNVLGISSYDSETGILIKSDDEDNAADYKTELILSDEQLSDIYNKVKNLDIESYPDYYDPINDPESDSFVEVSPSTVLILTVKYGDVNKTVKCMTLAGDKGYNDKAQAFLDTCEYIRKILVESDEWLSLPDITKGYC